MQGALRALFGCQSARDYWFPEIRSLGGAILMLSLVLYPYVYLLARSAFLAQSRTLMEAARGLGRSGRGALLRVAVPMARPAILGGVARAPMETLADFATVNVNFWITRDDANLDPQSGGLVIWDKCAPREWDFAAYNGEAAPIREFLARSKARSVRVPYRANRAVIFDSDLFHETDRMDFKPGYENRRINVTLLYGRRKTH